MVTLLNSTHGLSISFYDQIAAGVTGLRKAPPGFRIHSVDAVDGGVVTEITASTTGLLRVRDQAEYFSKGSVGDSNESTGQ